MIIYIPKLNSKKLVHLSYSHNGSYAIRDFESSIKRGHNVQREILPHIKWSMDARGQDFVSVEDIEYWRKRLRYLTSQFFKEKNIEIDNNIEIQQKDIPNSTKLKTIKHTEILCRVRDIFSKANPRYNIFLGDHGKGSHGVFYREAEKESNRTYYSIKMYKSDPPAKGFNVKDPDGIIVENGVVKYVIEIKWGYLKEYPGENTDLKSIFEDKELKEILDANKYLKTCRVIGPYVKDGNEWSDQFVKQNYKIDSNTKYIIVSDIKGLFENNYYDFNIIKKQYFQYRDYFTICDINENVDNFLNLKNYLALEKN